MSEMEKAIEQKLADARAQSDKKDAKPSDNKADVKKTANSGATGTSAAKKDDGKAAAVAKKPINTAKKPADGGKTAVVQKTAGANAVKKVAAKPAANQKATPGAKPTAPKASPVAKKPDGKATNQKAAASQPGPNAKKPVVKSPAQKAPASGAGSQTGSSPKKVVAKPSATPKASTAGAQAGTSAKKDESKQPTGATNKVASKTNEVKTVANDDKERKDTSKVGQKGKEEKSGTAKAVEKSDKSNGNADSSTKNAEKKVDKKETRDDSAERKSRGSDGDRRSRRRSRSKSSRDRSRSPMIYKRNYNYYGRNYDPNYHRRKYDSHSSYRRSPYRGRTRSPLPPRRRSRSPHSRRSPSPRRYDSRRRSPRRRSRSRSNRDRSRSTDRIADPKALRAKKSFLDDLAVKFAQEGKEFPELEQYRCEINRQFVQYPTVRNQFSRHAMEHSCASTDPYLDMDVCPPAADPIATPIVLTDPYNAYPLFPEAQPLVSYPMQVEPMVMHSPALDSPQPSVDSFQQDKNSVANSAEMHRSAGSKPSAPTEIWTKQEVKLRVKQAIKLLDDADSGRTKTAKFLYRAPTVHGKGVNEDRSPVLKSTKNPTFAFSCRSAETSDPFGNIPRKLKPIVDVLRMDEGQISYRILQRHQQRELALIAEREKVQAEERARRSQGTTAATSTSLLQKTTQTDPTVCTDCLLRKIKVRYNGETQTDVVRTVDSIAQTNPMPVQAVSEFGSITELTPNQVRAVSELIKYIKLTVTSGTLTEMRDSLRDDQVYNLNNDLRTAYDYFDAMVEHKNPSVPLEDDSVVENVPFDTTDDYNEPDTFIEDENFANDYDEIHKNFCDDDEDAECEDLESYSNPLLQGQPTMSSFQRNVDTRDNFTRSTGNAYGGSGGHFGGPSRSSYNQQSHGQRGGRGMNKGSHPVPFNRRN